MAKKKRIIAIDCDDVLINASQFLADTYNNLYGTNVQLATVHSSKNPDWQADRAEVFRRLHQIQLSEEFLAIAPRPDAIEVIPRLSERFELHLVTARELPVLPVTTQMVERYFPGYITDIRHVGADHSKGEVCQEIRASVMIDDNVRHLDDALKHGVEVTMCFGDYPWQLEQHQVAEQLHIVRCRNWYEIEKRLCG
jgi:5'(3')-deoxyribonucleotidase